MARPSHARAVSNSCYMACSTSASNRRRKVESTQCRESTPSPASSVTSLSYSNSSSPTSSPSRSVTSVLRSYPPVSSPSIDVTNACRSSASSCSPSSSQGRSGRLRVVKGLRASTPRDSSPANAPPSTKSKVPEPCVMLMPGPANKLDRMMTLIPCADARFYNDPGANRIEFAAKQPPRVLRLAKTERMRSLISLAHHFEELDLRRAMNVCPDVAAAS